MLIFDALTGNNDRHFYNWGVLKDIRGKRRPVFSPIYDSARGLFWNTSEARIENLFKNGNEVLKSQFESFLNKYTINSQPKIGWEGYKKINHYELMSLIYNDYPTYRGIFNTMCNNKSLQNVLNMLKSEFNDIFSQKRLILIEGCLKKRFSVLIKMCS